MIEVNHDDLILRTFILFFQTARAAMKYADAHFYKKARLSVIKFIVLRVIASKNGVMTPSEIAEWTQTERHNITALIERMNGTDLSGPSAIRGTGGSPASYLLTRGGRL